MSTIPADVLAWFVSVFAECNRRVTEKLTMAPNAPETSLDQTWIEELSRYSVPLALPSGWQVQIESHYLGGLRHWGNWEIADIGMLVRFRSPQAVRKRKVALLQSKRLYPTVGRVREELLADFALGFGRFEEPEDDARSLGLAREFRFNLASRYQAIEPGSHQVRAIEAYQQQVGLRVYYQLYNPWRVPSSQRIPLSGYKSPAGPPDLGVRILPALAIHSITRKKGGSPSLKDLQDAGEMPQYGWRLESFVAELLECRAGNEVQTADDPKLQTLFYRRSGPIAAAISITVESPDPDVVF